MATPGAATVAVVVAALGGAVAVAADGSPGWRLARLAVVGAVAADVVAARRHHGRTGPFVALAGLVAVAAGAAVVRVHPVAGAALVLGGGVLAVDGLVGALRRHARWWQRSLVGVGSLVAVVLAVLLVTIPVLVTNVPATGVGDRTPGDVGLTYTDVRIAGVDGTRLAAWYVPASNGAAVVLLHGSGSTRASTLEQAAVLADHGYGVLLLDARGHGDSEGRAMDLGWHGSDDLATAAGWLAGRPGVDPSRVGAVGLSMGGEEAIGALATDAPLAAVVAEGATGRVADDFAWLSREYGARGALQEALERAQQTVTDALTSASPPASLRSSVAAGEAPVLLVAAGTVADEVAAAEWLRSAAPDRVDVWVVDGAAHTDGLDVDPAGWERRVVGFLDRSLSDRPG